MYIGREPQIGNFQVCDAITVVDAQAAYTMQVDTVDVSPESANHMIVSLNGVIQKPTDAYTVSGSTITFASALETGDVIDFIQILGNVLDLGVPSDDTVSLAKLTATGTKDATTFLRGDNTFQTIGTNTPAFEAYLGGSGGQAVSDNTVTLVQANTEVYDTDSAYNTSTYRFTPQVSGKYVVYGSVLAEAGSSSNLNENYLYIKKNGSNITEYEKNFTSNPIRIDLIQVNAIIDMNGSSDYLELYGRINSASGSGQLFESDTQYKRATAFGAYRIIE
jgi:hypothetical protein